MSAVERRVTVVAVITPFVGFCVAVWRSWGGAVTSTDLAIFGVMYVLCGFGVTVGFHRLLTHRSFEAVGWIRATLAIFGSMAVQGAVIHWVADHRKHHAYADRPGDPHSPHTSGGAGWRGVIRGIWHSHIGWLLDRSERASARRFARDLRADPVIALVDRLFFLWVGLGLLIPFLAGLALSGGELGAGMTALLWGGLVRIFLFHHATWSVNSICHLYGKQPLITHDESRNNWPVALVALGEGWHHNHHAFPTSARHGLLRGQLDPSFAVIRVLERVGLASHVCTFPPERIAARRADNGQIATPDAAARDVSPAGVGLGLGPSEQ